MGNSKLKNTKAVTEMLAGVHKTQTKTTVGFENSPTYVRRSVGEQWEDENGDMCEQKAGYKVKLGKLHQLREDLRKFPNCMKEVCDCKNPKRLDEKMRAFHGMCFDCVLSMESKLRISGEYDRYEKRKMLENAKAWLKQAQFEKEALKVALKMKFINENGSVEEWNGVNIEDVLLKVDTDFEKLRVDYIGKLEKELEETTT
jgi:hypothetical protein